MGEINITAKSYEIRKIPSSSSAKINLQHSNKYHICCFNKLACDKKTNGNYRNFSPML